MHVFRVRVAIVVVLACLLAHGIASAQSFTGVGAAPASAEVLAPLGDVVSYTVSGTFVGTVVVEQSQGGGSAAWITRVTLSAPATGTFVAETVSPDGSGTPARYRFRCSAYTSGTIVASLSSAAAPTGSGTPGGAYTQVQFNDTGKFGGDSALTFDKTLHSLAVGTGNLGGVAGHLNVTALDDGNEAAFIKLQNTTPGIWANALEVQGQFTTAGTGDDFAAAAFIQAVDQTQVGAGAGSVTALEVKTRGSLNAGTASLTGIHVDSPAFTGATTTSRAISIDDQTGATTAYAIYYAAPSSKTFSVAANGNVLANGTTTSTFVSQGSGVAVANVGANSCGTTTATIAGNDNAGTITVGATSGSQCRVTFVNAAANRRECTVTDETTTIATRAAYVDTTHTDFLGGFGAGDLVSYVCFAR